MEAIKLLGIAKTNRTIVYDFTVSDGLKQFFTGKPFFVEYPLEITAVPDAVAAVPFVCSVLPLIWISGSVLEIPELDGAFYRCLPELKKGYEAMYPETTFPGELRVGKVIDCDTSADGGCAVFFSGGLDSVHTLISHLEEKPALISIWGADVACDNEEGWKTVSGAIDEYSEAYGLEEAVIRSGFRAFDMEWEVDKVYREQLKTNWWYGAKHGIALLGHAAPYAYLKKLSTVYIASSNCVEEKEDRCASDPTLDNHVRFTSCRVIHDGYEYGRQDKVHNLVEYVHTTGKAVPLHVCWESQTGSNCCECEKCYRTILGLLAEGEDPADYGFANAADTLGKMRQVIIGGRKIGSNVNLEWRKIQERVRQNREMLRQKPSWKYIKWIDEADLSHPEKLTLPLGYRLRKWLSQFRLLQAVYNLRK